MFEFTRIMKELNGSYASIMVVLLVNYVALIKSTVF